MERLLAGRDTVAEGDGGEPWEGQEPRRPSMGSRDLGSGGQDLEAMASHSRWGPSSGATETRRGARPAWEDLPAPGLPISGAC